MAKDYFQDITPPQSDNNPTPQRSVPSSNPEPQEPLGRTIRNIQVSTTRQKLRGSDDMRGELHVPPAPPSPRRRGSSFSRYALWGGVGLALLVLAAIAFIAFRPTSITVIPRSHTVIFDQTAQFTAYPVESAATNTLLTFTIETLAFDDSQTVPARGIEHVEERASGTITIYNNYSTSPVNLIENTRFETPEGFVFRSPSAIVVPGKRGSTPGEISATVFAAETGAEYNVGPIDTFRLPGLESSPEMYQGVYASSNSSMNGGFSGERPVADPAAIEAAQAQIRSRLEEQARAAAEGRTTSATVAFIDLARMNFETLAPTPEGEGNMRLNERLRLELPTFPADSFAYLVGESVSAGVEEGAVELVPGEGFAARPTETTSSSFAASPLTFTLDGRAQLIWNVDTAALAQALAGRDEVAFQAIVEGFPGIEEARARIEPFWKRSFPEDPTDMRISVEDPTNS